MLINAFIQDGVLCLGHPLSKNIVTPFPFSESELEIYAVSPTDPDIMLDIKQYQEMMKEKQKLKK